jgi:hypothetical protein
MRVAFSQCRTDLRATVFIAEPAASVEVSFTRDESASVYLSARSGENDGVPESGPGIWRRAVCLLVA